MTSLSLSFHGDLIHLYYLSCYRSEGPCTAQLGSYLGSCQPEITVSAGAEAQGSAGAEAQWSI